MKERKAEAKEQKKQEEKKQVNNINEKKESNSKGNRRKQVEEEVKPKTYKKHSYEDTSSENWSVPERLPIDERLVIGLNNMGNTCFFDSLVQNINNLDLMHIYYDDINPQLYDPTSVTIGINSFLRQMLKSDKRTPIEKIFAGVTQSIVICQNCYNPSITHVPTFALTLTLPSHEQYMRQENESLKARMNRMMNICKTKMRNSNPFKSKKDQENKENNNEKIESTEEKEEEKTIVPGLKPLKERQDIRKKAIYLVNKMNDTYQKNKGNPTDRNTLQKLKMALDYIRDVAIVDEEKKKKQYIVEIIEWKEGYTQDIEEKEEIKPQISSESSVSSDVNSINSNINETTVSSANSDSNNSNNTEDNAKSINNINDINNNISTVTSSNTINSTITTTTTTTTSKDIQSDSSTNILNNDTLLDDSLQSNKIYSCEPEDTSSPSPVLHEEREIHIEEELKPSSCLEDKKEQINEDSNDNKDINDNKNINDNQDINDNKDINDNQDNQLTKDTKATDNSDIPEDSSISIEDNKDIIQSVSSQEENNDILEEQKIDEQIKTEEKEEEEKEEEEKTSLYANTDSMDIKISKRDQIYKDCHFHEADQTINSDATLHEALQKYFSTETLLTENGVEYICSKCSNKKVNRDIWKRATIESLPNVLVIHFKRFYQTSRGSYTKNTDFVNFPICLEMKDFCMASLQNEDTWYTLSGVVNHSGSLSGGHYTCYIKGRDEQWYYISDSYAAPATEKQVLSSEAYMLFYVRNTQTNFDN
ncbi:hypothetical protein WA158_000982 [Blastocystis sp. Blastoise]